MEFGTLSIGDVTRDPVSGVLVSEHELASRVISGVGCGPTRESLNPS